jgi:hypothetical protein
MIPPLGESAMALATLHIAAIPVAAGLLAGTGAVTAYVASPAQTAPQAIATAAAPVATQSRPCAEQTWPYIDQKCIASAGPRTVRLISAPRGGEATGDASAPVTSGASAAAARAAEPGLVTGDTVLRQPQPLATPEIEPNAQVAKPRAKRETRRQRDRRWDAQSYQVPSEFGRGGRPVIVVRPLRLEAFR